MKEQRLFDLLVDGDFKLSGGSWPEIEMELAKLGSAFERSEIICVYCGDQAIAPDHECRHAVMSKED